MQTHTQHQPSIDDAPTDTFLEHDTCVLVFDVIDACVCEHHMNLCTADIDPLLALEHTRRHTHIYEHCVNYRVTSQATECSHLCVYVYYRGTRFSGSTSQTSHIRRHVVCVSE